MGVNSGSGAISEKLTRFALADTIVALMIQGLVNSPAVFHGNRLQVTSIEEAYRTLSPLLGGLSNLVFAIALLFSGLPSFTTATLAGQVIMEGFLKIRIRLWLRRLITRLVTLVRALIAIGLGVDPLRLLIISQVILSVQLPFTIIPLLHFTRKRQLMGDYANGKGTKSSVC